MEGLSPVHFDEASVIGQLRTGCWAAEPMVWATAMLIFLNLLNLQQIRFMKDFLVLSVVKWLKRPPRETVKSPSLEVLKNRLHKHLSGAAQTYVILPSNRRVDKISWDLCLGFSLYSTQLQPEALYLGVFLKWHFCHGWIHCLYSSIVHLFPSPEEYM